MENATFDVCLSFAGDDREYVDAVASALSELGVSIFYDVHQEVELWGKDLYQHLDEVYRTRGRFCVVFISRAYAQKLWTRHELRSAQARAFKENREYILPARFDDTDLPGVLPTTAYIDLRTRAPREFASDCQKVRHVSEPATLVATSGSRASRLPSRLAARIAVYGTLLALGVAIALAWPEPSYVDNSPIRRATIRQSSSNVLSTTTAPKSTTGATEGSKADSPSSTFSDHGGTDKKPPSRAEARSFVDKCYADGQALSRLYNVSYITERASGEWIEAFIQWRRGCVAALRHLDRYRRLEGSKIGEASTFMKAADYWCASEWPPDRNPRMKDDKDQFQTTRRVQRCWWDLGEALNTLEIIRIRNPALIDY